MTQYLAHIFDVDDNGAVICSTETVHKYECPTDEDALNVGNSIRQERDKTEPLQSGENYICNVWLLDEDGEMEKQI